MDEVDLEAEVTVVDVTQTVIITAVEAVAMILTEEDLLDTVTTTGIADTVAAVGIMIVVTEAVEEVIIMAVAGMVEIVNMEEVGEGHHHLHTMEDHRLDIMEVLRTGHDLDPLVSTTTKR